MQNQKIIIIYFTVIIKFNSLFGMSVYLCYYFKSQKRRRGYQTIFRMRLVAQHHLKSLI